MRGDIWSHSPADIQSATGTRHQALTGHDTARSHSPTAGKSDITNADAKCSKQIREREKQDIKYLAAGVSHMIPQVSQRIERGFK